MKTFFFLLPFFLLFAQPAIGQNYFTLTGKVLDQKSKRPVGYAHVGIPEKGIGTTTGHDGSFEFKVPEEFAGSKMIVSFMGYRTYSKPISAHQNGGTIYIEPSTTDLIEVVVMEEKAIEDIIRRAVRNIPKNYPSRPTNVLGFYRESLTDDSLRYRYLAEGVLNIYKTDYEKISEGEVGLVQGRKINLKDPLDTTVYSGLSSGHMAAHRFDFVKNREDFIDETFFPAYKYWIEKITTYNDRPVYVIGFNKDEEARPVEKGGSRWKGLSNRLRGKSNNGSRVEGRMKGRLFIEQESYAFVRAEFEILPEGLKKYDDYPLYSGSWHGNKYVVNYRKIGGTWHFSDALREGERPNGGLYANEIKITEITPGKSDPIPYLERMARGYQFVNMTGTYDEDFWKNYNTTPLNQGLSESVQQMKNMQKAQEVFEANYMAGLQRQRDSIQALELLKIKEQTAQEKGISVAELESLGEAAMPEELRRINKVRKQFNRMKFFIGTGVHFLPTSADGFSLRYHDDDGETILALQKDISSREQEITAQWGFDVFFNPHLFMRIGNTFNFTKTIYKDWALGIGTQLNLSKGRPVFFRPMAQYQYLQYARVVGNADNDYGKFKVNGKKFKSESVRMSYGSRTHNLQLSAELAIELHPSRELYLRGGYHRTFASQQNVWFKERKEVFRKDARLPVKNDRLGISANDAPFNDRLTPDQTFSVTVGLLFK